MEYSNLFVVLMGIGTVFVGLICIIIIITIMGKVCEKLVKTPPVAPVAAAPVPAAPTVSAITPAMIAAISAAVAEEMGTDVSAIRIVSIKKV